MENAGEIELIASNPLQSPPPKTEAIVRSSIGVISSSVTIA